MKIKKLIGIWLGLLGAAMALGQTSLPVPDPITVDRPDSSFSSVIAIHGEEEEVLTGEYRNARILLSDIKKLTIKDLRLFDCDVRIAGCDGHTATNVYIRGGAWNVYPTAVARGWMFNPAAWYSATNFTWIGGDHRTTFAGGNGLQTIMVPLDQLKNGRDPATYASAKWKFRDSTGKTFNPALWDWVVDGSNAVIRFSPRGSMAAGSGFWSCESPNGFLRGLKYTGIDADGMDYFAVYFADGLTFTKSRMGPSTLDYTLGFEYCVNVNLSYLTVWGNKTKQGNAADVAFLAGVRGLTVKNCDIGTLAITSSGWEVSGVDSDTAVSWLDWGTGWIGKVIEQGVMRRDDRGVELKSAG